MTDPNRPPRPRLDLSGRATTAWRTGMAGRSRGTRALGLVLALLLAIPIAVVLVVLLVAVAIVAIVAWGVVAAWRRVRALWPSDDGRENVRVIRRR